MATKTKAQQSQSQSQSQTPPSSSEDDELVTVKLFRSEANAIAIYARAHGISQPEAGRRAVGAALNEAAQDALETLKTKLTSAKQKA